MTSPVRESASAAADLGGLTRASSLSQQTMVFGGSVCVMLGGLVAAVTQPLELVKGSWLAAYLVLVCGVGSYTIGKMQARREAPMPSIRAWSQLGCWCMGNAAVIVGSLTSIAVVVDASVLPLMVALGIAMAEAVRPAVPADRGPASPAAARLAARRSVAARLSGWAHRCLLAILLICVPIGAVMAHLQDIR